MKGERYDECDKVSEEEIDVIIKKRFYDSVTEIYDFIIKNDLTDAAFIMDVLT
jgi:type III secretion system FlhB-like substrate exporter